MSDGSYIGLNSRRKKYTCRPLYIDVPSVKRPEHTSYQAFTPILMLENARQDAVWPEHVAGFSFRGVHVVLDRCGDITHVVCERLVSRLRPRLKYFRLQYFEFDFVRDLVSSLVVFVRKHGHLPNTATKMRALGIAATRRGIIIDIAWVLIEESDFDNE